MRFPRFASVAVALALMTGACGDSTGPQIELSQAEAEELFDVLDEILGGLDFGVGFSQASPRLPGLMLSSAGMPPVNESSSCTGGGNVSINGNVSDGSSENFDFDLTLGFNSCKDEGYTVNGDLDYAGNGTLSQTSFSFSFSINGTLTVTLPDARTGSCTFDVEANISGQTGSVTSSRTGARRLGEG